MITYVELWKAKQAWTDLSKEERGNYMAQLGPAIQQLIDSGVKIESWGINEAATHSRVDFDYFGVWTFPDMEAAQNFEQLVVGAGWYNYFDQVNAMGTTANPTEVIGKMIEE